jgi:hypothetical protein
MYAELRTTRNSQIELTLRLEVLVPEARSQQAHSELRPKAGHIADGRPASNTGFVLDRTLETFIIASLALLLYDR